MSPQSRYERILIDMFPPIETDMLREFWRDPAPFEAERIAGQARIDALFAGHDMARDARQAAMWAEQGDTK